MSGLYLFAVVGLLGYLAWRFGEFAARRIPIPWLAKVCQVLLTLLLMSLLVADEIVGGYQFRELCQENSAIQVDRAAARGKTVYYDPQPSVDVEGTWVRIVMQPWRHVHAVTGEPVLTYYTLIAAGGRFIRMLGISEGGMPLTFTGTCRPKESVNDLVKSLGITVLDRPKQNIKEN